MEDKEAGKAKNIRDNSKTSDTENSEGVSSETYMNTSEDNKPNVADSNAENANIDVKKNGTADVSLSSVHDGLSSTATQMKTEEEGEESEKCQIRTADPENVKSEIEMSKSKKVPGPLEFSDSENEIESCHENEPKASNGKINVFDEQPLLQDLPSAPIVNTIKNMSSQFTETDDNKDEITPSGMHVHSKNVSSATNFQIRSTEPEEETADLLTQQRKIHRDEHSLPKHQDMEKPKKMMNRMQIEELVRQQQVNNNHTPNTNFPHQHPSSSSSSSNAGLLHTGANFPTSPVDTVKAETSWEDVEFKKWGDYIKTEKGLEEYKNVAEKYGILHHDYIAFRMKGKKGHTSSDHGGKGTKSMSGQLALEQGSTKGSFLPTSQSNDVGKGKHAETNLDRYEENDLSKNERSSNSWDNSWSDWNSWKSNNWGNSKDDGKDDSYYNNYNSWHNWNSWKNSDWENTDDDAYQHSNSRSMGPTRESRKGSDASNYPGENGSHSSGDIVLSSIVT